MNYIKNILLITLFWMYGTKSLFLPYYLYNMYHHPTYILTLSIIGSWYLFGTLNTLYNIMKVCVYEILIHRNTIYPVFKILVSDTYNKYKNQTIYKYNKIVSYIDNTKYGNCIIQWIQSGRSSVYSIVYWINKLIDKGNTYITLFLKKITTIIYKIPCIKKRIDNYKQKYRDMVEITLDQHNKFNYLNEHMEKTSDELKKINEQLE